MSSLTAFYHKHTTILDRYLFREFTGPFLLAIGGFALIGIIDILFYLVELAIMSGVSIPTIIQLLVYKLPAIMVLFFPMAVLFAVMLLLVRMAKDNEITILRASGVHTFRFLAPVILLTITTSFLSYLINEKVVPWTNTTSEKLIRKEIHRKPPPNIIENVVFKDSGNRHFYIKKIHKKTNHMQNLMIFEEKSKYARLITSKEAIWNKKSWILLNGRIVDINNNGETEFIDKFEQMTIYMDQGFESYFARQKTTKEMDSKELKTKIKNLQKGGISTRSLKVEFYMKQSIPTACFIFGIIGIAFCLTFVRSGKDWWGVIIAICIAVLTVGFYFFIVAVFRALGKDGAILPFLGAWIPNMLYGTASLILLGYQSIYK